MGLTTKPAPSGEATLTVGDLARQSGVAESAVRFYEKHGLISSERTPGNQRRFRETTACIIKIVRVAQRVGLSVAEIRELMSDLPGPSEITIDDWFHLRERLEKEVRQRIDALHAVLGDLTSDGKLCELPPVSEAPGVENLAGRRGRSARSRI